MGAAAIRCQSWLWLRQTEKTPGLVGDIAKIQQSEAFTNDIEQIPMLPCRTIRLFARTATSVRSTMQADIERPSRRVMNVADKPVIAVTATSGEVMAAHRLSVLGQPARQIGCIP
ncbi:hypothetical protein KBA01_19310 [Kozakia baliensis]|nr:hypothetical protein KBA01_19310 [Kozakia baliensis]